jgi:hypothetical protein
MSTTQTQPEAAQAPAQPKANDLSKIADETVRRQYEWALADEKAGRTYGPGLGIDPALASLKIAYGRDFGFLPAQSLKFIHVIGGVPSLESSGRSNLLVKAGYSWKAVQHDDTTANFQFYKHGEPMTDAADKPLRVEFSMKDAERAGYIESSRGKNAKGNYDRVPKNMLFARCMANFHRWHASEVDGSGMADPSEIMERVVLETEMRMPEALTLKVAANATT